MIVKLKSTNFGGDYYMGSGRDSLIRLMKGTLGLEKAYVEQRVVKPKYEEEGERRRLVLVFPTPEGLCYTEYWKLRDEQLASLKAFLKDHCFDWASTDDQDDEERVAHLKPIETAVKANSVKKMDAELSRIQAETEKIRKRLDRLGVPPAPRAEPRPITPYDDNDYW